MESSVHSPLLQAEPASPSGDGPNLTGLGLIPADAIMTEWTDALILDENDPTSAIPNSTSKTRQPPSIAVHVSTMADPRSLDLTVDPDERTPVTCDLGDPQMVDMSPVAWRRMCTLRNRLSQWSYEDACRPSHARRIFGAIGHPDKEIYEIARREPLLRRGRPARQAARRCRHRHGLAGASRLRGRP